jgi:hypothetical protein
MIVGLIYDDFHAVRVHGAHQAVEGGKGIRVISEVLLNLREVAVPIAVIGSRDTRAHIVQVFVVDRRGNPDSRCPHPLDIGELLLDAGKIATPISLPLGFGRVI